MKMENTRTKNVFLIMFSSGLRQVLTLISQFVSQTVFIYILGAGYLGLNGLFNNILSLLSLTELGIGSAILFYMYKPLAEHDTERIKTLMQFYKKCYRFIGFFMITIGVCIIPLLPKLVNFEQNLDVNLYLVYFLYLLNTACSYLALAYKQALPMANQEQYKIEKINMQYVIINCVADVTVLIFFKNYILYLFIKLLLIIAKNFSISITVDKEYPYIKEKTIIKFKNTEIKTFFTDIKDVAIFKAGSSLYNCTDNLIISVMLGTVIVGYYSNYFLIISAISSFINLFVRAFTAGIGNLIAVEDKKIQYQYFLQIDFIVYLAVSLCTTCMFQLLNPFIQVWVGGVDNSYILSQTVVGFLSISFYLDGTTQIMNIFREASGNFKIGRNYQIAGGIFNIILSIIFGRYFKLEGIFFSTIICKSAVSLFPFMIVISKVVFEKGKFNILKNYLKKTAATILSMSISFYWNTTVYIDGIIGMIIKTVSAILIWLITMFIFFHKTYEMKTIVDRFKKITINFRN